MPYTNTITTQCTYKDAAAIAMRQPLSLRLPISDLAKTAYEVHSLLQPTAMAGADINISDGYFCPWNSSAGLSMGGYRKSGQYRRFGGDVCGIDGVAFAKRPTYLAHSSQQYVIGW